MEPKYVKKKCKFLSVNSLDIEKEVWEASDGTCFKMKVEAQGYQNKLDFLNKFKETFNKEKNNFKISDNNIALLYSSVFKDEWPVIDYFCVKISLETEIQELLDFCNCFYDLKNEMGSWDKREKKIPLGWLYVFFVAKPTKVGYEDHYYRGEKFGYYLSEKVLKEHIKVLQNNLPLGIIEESEKINNRKSLLDID